ncbi:MAG TPA: hypothetical protein VG125_16485 [Pirellulales bacterium]|nr:hypothetical protein [Pirellulales bacterium]
MNPPSTLVTWLAPGNSAGPRRHQAACRTRRTDGGHTWLNWRDYLHEFAPLLFSESGASAKAPVRDDSPTASRPDRNLTRPQVEVTLLAAPGALTNHFCQRLFR